MVQEYRQEKSRGRREKGNERRKITLSSVLVAKNTKLLFSVIFFFLATVIIMLLNHTSGLFCPLCSRPLLENKFCKRKFIHEVAKDGKQRVSIYHLQDKV
jgi:hypothetical protein